jgi:hypothetical protein
LSESAPWSSSSSSAVKFQCLKSRITIVFLGTFPEETTDAIFLEHIDIHEVYGPIDRFMHWLIAGKVFPEGSSAAEVSSSSEIAAARWTSWKVIAWRSLVRLSWRH